MPMLDQHLDGLREAGLLVSEPYVNDDITDVGVCKPRDAGGNALPGFEAVWRMDGPDLDAPGLGLRLQDGLWHVPGPGPGDFENVHNTPEMAVADIIDFFFGDPARMAAKRVSGSTDA